MHQLDPLDKKLLQIIQDDFPLVSEPFTEIGARVGLSAEETLARLKKLKQKGILRHFGASINSRKLGFVTTLCAVSAPAEKEEAIAKQIAIRPEVTHCYLRKHKFNIWFTLVAKDWPAVEKILEEIAKETGLRPRHFPARKMFKLRAVFHIADN
ncbi:Lrp/AsnC family transcriptional regulator [Thermodesulfatator autotrophicus]|uniref:siroheme decarboxylase n=1 Tax=Thermodesulfatator autotrophicus TaxID=1795632 RepID=A0A177EAA0_9BACT|nr:AsnC family transcriptional regulator [Thermodesulfatator autotrophicus]OAG28666.1 hypothetical protein TH606_00780 [Thermodesulfatator autotrophicus]